jgi:hypothetical protein
MSNPKWQMGPVKLVDGSEGHIDFVQPKSKHYRYIGRAKESDGEWRAWQWSDCGRVPYTTTGYAKNLAPPPKKTMRVKGWLNVYANGNASFWKNKDNADSQTHRFSCIEIDREVEEGEGLS